MAAFKSGMTPSWIKSCKTQIQSLHVLRAKRFFPPFILNPGNIWISLSHCPVNLQYTNDCVFHLSAAITFCHPHVTPQSTSTSVSCLWPHKDADLWHSHAETNESHAPTTQPLGETTSQLKTERTAALTEHWSHTCPSLQLKLEETWTHMHMWEVGKTGLQHNININKNLHRQL